ncbi:MAG: hypothetical protein SGJ24_20010 [Chloroflexota bacterium]|nr:hypothetical protein [Chloroflexota bacterium]
MSASDAFDNVQYLLTITIDTDAPYEMPLTRTRYNAGGQEHDEIFFETRAVLSFQRLPDGYGARRTSTAGLVTINEVDMTVGELIRLDANDVIVIDSRILIRYTIRRIKYVTDSVSRRSRAEDRAPVVIVKPLSDDYDPDIGAIQVRESHDLMVIPVEQTRRLCDFCFTVLNSNDTNVQKRALVQVGERAYHADCLAAHPELESSTAELLNLPPALALPVVVRIPIVGEGSPTNLITDTPIGISVSSLGLETPPTGRFFIRNNTAAPVTLQRAIGRPWLAMDYASPIYHNTLRQPGSTIDLSPGMEMTVAVAASPITPLQRRVIVPLHGRQAIEVVFNSFNALLFIAIAIFAVVYWLHLGTIFDYINSGWWSGTFAETLPFFFGFLFTQVLVNAWFVVMQPVTTQWRAFTLSSALYRRLRGVPLINTALSFLVTLVWSPIREGALARIHEPRVLLTLTGVMTVISTVALLIPSILLWLLLNSGVGMIVALVYSAALLYLFARVMGEYELHLIQFITQSARQTIRQVRRMTK